MFLHDILVELLIVFVTILLRDLMQLLLAKFGILTFVPDFFRRYLFVDFVEDFNEKHREKSVVLFVRLLTKPRQLLEEL